MRAHGLAKSASAFRTISEVSAELDVPQHVLRFWETRFPQIRPLKRGGGRRYYRPEDVALLRRIQSLLYSEGYTIKGVQRLLRESRGSASPPGATGPDPDVSVVDPAAGDGADGERLGDQGDGHPDDPRDNAAGEEREPEGITLPEDVRRELVAVLNELHAIRALLGKQSD